MHFETKAIHVGEEPNLKEGGSGDVVVPIHLASTFARAEVEHPTGGYEYSRSLNPTRLALERRLAALESADYGLALASGMAAEALILISALKPGDHVVAFNDLYGGTRRLFEKVFRDAMQLDFDYVDASDSEKVFAAATDKTKMIWLETPTNPLMRMCDISEISMWARERGILVVVDNTFASSYFQQPLALNAHVVVHSTTKYLNGHSDSVGGAIMLRDKALYEKLQFNQNAIGPILSPFDSFLVLRGLKTLALRMRASSESALKLATWLESHPKVERVYYPGLPSHPQHKLAQRQMSGFGGMISFDIAGGLDAAKRFLAAVKIFALAESLGGVESLIEHPAIMTHASIPREVREREGLSDALVRISVGIEHVEDLQADLDSAFKAV